ncbi:MAG: general secretion pathway protein GspB, partial [Kiritimatiellae bacterium]|nr:general secretion pathway protein GspB [Kiritimatiellia bacterium]
LAVNVFKVGKKSSTPPTSPPLAASGHLAPIKIGADVAPPPSVGEQVQSQVPEPALDPKVLAEQQQIAARLPRRNPFCVAEDGRLTTDNGRLTGNNEIKLKVTAIVSRQGSNKRIAMINGKMLEEGDRIGEWTILKVNPKNVILGNGAQQRVVGVK